jgi:preprotein translocase subunit SecG
METLLIVLHVAVCLFLVGIVLLQHGKGADIGATFGGSSQSLFGTEGPLPLLNKITTAAAIIFMLTSVALAYISSHTGTDSVMSGLTTPPPAQVEKVETKQRDETKPATQVETPAVKTEAQPAATQVEAPQVKTEAQPAATPVAGDKKE